MRWIISIGSVLPAMDLAEKLTAACLEDLGVSMGHPKNDQRPRRKVLRT